MITVGGAPPAPTPPPPGPQGAGPIPAAGMKVCPYCSEQIPVAAIKCPRCKENLIQSAPQPSPSEQLEAMEERRAAVRDEMEAADLAKSGFWFGFIGFLCCPIVSIIGFIKGLQAYSIGSRAGHHSGYTPWALIFGGLGTLWFIANIVIAVTGGYSAFLKESAVADHEQCEKNMATLGDALQKYFKDMEGSPEETGAQLWLTFARDGRVATDTLICPASGDAPGPGACSYRGPILPVYQLGPHSPVACDDPKNHSDGSIHVLYLNWKVELIQKSDPKYKQAIDALAK